MWNGNRERPVGLGCLYYYLTQLLFPREGNEGKVMGLSAYGDPSRLPLPPLLVDGHSVIIPDEWLELFDAHGRYDYFSSGVGSFQDCADLAACGQLAFETGLLEIARWIAGQSGARTLCYAGGAALNCVANSKLLMIDEISDIHIPPAPHDGRAAVGCPTYGAIQETLFQIADLLAFCINRNTHLAMKENRAETDTQFMRIVGSMRIRSDDISYTLRPVSFTPEDFDKFHATDRFLKGLEDGR